MTSFAIFAVVLALTNASPILMGMGTLPMTVGQQKLMQMYPNIMMGSGLKTMGTLRTVYPNQMGENMGMLTTRVTPMETINLQAGLTGTQNLRGLCNGLQCSDQQMNQKSQIVHDMTEQVMQNQMKNTMNVLRQTIQQGEMENEGQQTMMAGKLAQELVLQGREAEKAQLQQSIQQVQQRSTNMMGFGQEAMVLRMAQQQAMKELQQDMLKQEQLTMGQEIPTEEMMQTIQTVIEAQMVARGIQMQNPTMRTIMNQMVEKLQNEIQQLLKENNMMTTHSALMRCRTKVLQLQRQIQMITQQLQEIMVKITMMQKQAMTLQVQQMTQVVQQMQHQIQKLMIEELAQQIAMEQLQQVLLSQQKQLIEQKTEEQLMQINGPLTMMPMMQTPMMMRV